jgi:hypothetical protein
MRGAISIVLVVGVTALAGCGGSSDNGASQSELNQAQKEGAQKERQKQRLRSIEKQLKKLKKQQGKPPTTGSTPPGSTSGSGSGGSTSCGDDLSVGPATTCGFAANVATDYYREIGSGSGTVQSFSPTTGQTYSMYCTAGEPHVCTGGNNAAVYFP